MMINYLSPWKIGALKLEYEPSKPLAFVNQEVIKTESEATEHQIYAFRVSTKIEYLVTGALWTLRLGFEPEIMGPDIKYNSNFMNYWVTMEPLNQAAKDFQKHPEVLSFVPATDPDWDGDSDYDSLAHNGIVLASSLDDRHFSDEYIRKFSKRWNVPLMPENLRQLWHKFVDLSKYPNLELNPQRKSDINSSFVHIFKHSPVGAYNR